MHFYSVSLIAALLISCLQAAEKPNIVIIYTDDQGYGDVGCYGAKGWKTPNIDQLAAEGVKFTDFYVSQPVCSASRASLLTGCYSNRLGIHGALFPAGNKGLDAKETTIAEVCKKAGYATSMVGKWHLGHQKEFLPIHHGFDEYLGLPYSNDMWAKGPVLTKPDYIPYPLPLVDGDKNIIYLQDQTYLTTWYTERAVDFIRRSKDKPFFLYLAHSMPHVPLYVSPKYKGSSEQGLYGDVMQEIDWSVGQVMDALKKNGIEKNTWVIFASDNGPWMIYGNYGGGTGPLRGSKGTTMEGGVRVPCIMRWPEKLSAGVTNNHMMMTIDILPTICKLLDQPLPELKIDGKNVWPLITNEEGAKNPHDAYFFYYGTNELEAMRMGDWKLLFPHKWRDARVHPGKDGRPGKYVWLKTGLELYNLRKDIGEKNNVIADHPDVVKKMQALAAAMREELGDNLTGAKGKGNRAPGIAR
ncbi:arylsulfatase [Oceaniferula spumae]|uniref:Arylsulfatase n=1 Tax=Oceaniferula spumae TaxID=2979115 RepID=A0AAT9FSM1_9BACT